MTWQSETGRHIEQHGRAKSELAGSRSGLESTTLN